MAKITPMSLIQNFSGRVCSEAQEYFKTNTSNGKVYAAKLCHPYQGEATEKQTEQRTKFGKLAKAANVWLNANKPSDDMKKGTALYQKAESLKRQYKLASVRSVVYRYMDSEGNVTLPSTTSTSGNDDNTL